MARIRVENDYHEFYRALAADDGESTRRRTFATMKDVFMLAVSFGASIGHRTQLGASREIFEDTRLRAEDWDVIKSVALSQLPERLDLLQNDDELIRIAEEFANTGIRVLKDHYLTAQPEESIAAAFIEQYAKTGAP